jgi:AAA+ ATPase superfamily predicted ATPase
VTIIGREKEQRDLREYMEAKQPDFLVVYGRRRVGKTFLIREYFDGSFCFHTTGLASKDKNEQLFEFNKSLNKYGTEKFDLATSWQESFHQLEYLISKSPEKGKKVIFIDEMPWMDTHKSGFLTGLESFWNGWASGRKDILLIACGSATSWITNKLFRNRGGLYNRVTKRMYLRPFTLSECEAFYKYRKIMLSRQQMVESYMIFGGIPYYLSLFDKDLSLPQNVDKLCFKAGGVLQGEYDSLYSSLFEHPDKHIKIIETLSKKRKGLTRAEIIANSGLTNSGALTKALAELEDCDFIRKYYSYGKISRDAIYQLIDFYSLFHLNIILENRGRDDNFWVNNLQSGARNAWSGYAFEQVCLAHIDRIKYKLGIAGVSTSIFSWLSKNSSPGAQIDLVIDRRDGVVNLCEMKYSNSEYTITKKYDGELRNKRQAFRSETKTRQSIHTTFVTTYGLTRNEYWGDIQSEVTMSDLF